MSWSGLLKREIESAYKVTAGLMDLVDDDALDWKPETGTNWMTTGQLLKHLAEGCGAACKWIVTGDRGMLDEKVPSDTSPEDMLPPAEKMSTIGSVAEARQELEKDRQLSLEMVASCSEEDLATKPTPMPWDPTEMILGHRLLQMVEHVKQHKAQLFYYLKLQGKPVDTSHLWGM